MEEEQDYITLKWGTLKSWNVKSAEGQALLEKYGELGYSMSAMAQHDTPEQKEIILFHPTRTGASGCPSQSK